MNSNDLYTGPHVFNQFAILQYTFKPKVKLIHHLKKN